MSGNETHLDRAQMELLIERITDRVMDSGIDFVHESVADSLSNWTPAHYDHGNSVALADSATRLRVTE